MNKRKRKKINVNRNAFGENCIHGIQFSRIFRTIGESFAARGGGAIVCFHKNILYMGLTATKIEIDEVKWWRVPLLRKKIEDSTAFVVSEAPIRCVFTFSLLKNRQRLSCSFWLAWRWHSQNCKKCNLKWVSFDLKHNKEWSCFLFHFCRPFFRRKDDALARTSKVRSLRTLLVARSSKITSIRSGHDFERQNIPIHTLDVDSRHQISSNSASNAAAFKADAIQSTTETNNRQNTHLKKPAKPQGRKENTGGASSSMPFDAPNRTLATANTPSACFCCTSSFARTDGRLSALVVCVWNAFEPHCITHGTPAIFVQPRLTQKVQLEGRTLHA